MLDRDTQSTTRSLEKQFQLEEILRASLPITNSYAWLAVVGSVSLRRKKAPYLTRDDISRITDGIKSTEGQNVAIAEIVANSGVADLTKDKFLQQISFNYDYEIGGEERFKNAYRELGEGKRTSVDPYYDDETMSLETWVAGDFKNFPNDHHGLRTIRIFDKKTEQITSAFELDGFRGSLVEKAITRTPLAIPLFPFALLLALSGPENTGGWRHYELIRETYRENVFPYLEKNELVKVSSNRIWPPKMSIVKR